MTDTLSEQYIKENCPFDQNNHLAFTYLLEETEDFRVACDFNPLTEGHILIVPKKHISCVGEYPEDLFNKFLVVYEKVSRFIISNYGSVSTFEHGKIGQTVFHSHVHLMPFNGNPLDIIPEGENHLEKIPNIQKLRGKTEYLFFSIEDNKFLVDPKLGIPRFFRERFAKALGVPERANWKAIQNDPIFRKKFNTENNRCKNLWLKYYPK